ncbi:hypothetical protein [Leptothoe kymatousa]|uniref:Uncharacterized protein n=1 Tax=Leptothoe kymatousa TAU-MAC 1615 TaxID=2364775 RepID=A0ABS5Y4N3_9CYAN|nr:hypothetical protein [Leptothoe kymatousa]MBT9312804.1 hypothetical protein [Leptothoe kymatousa TAU-MAC 1615]
MTDSNRIQQSAKNVGKNALQVGGDYTQTTSINLNLIISVFFISVVAFGGLAWSLNLVGKGSGGDAGLPNVAEQAQ